MILLPDGKGSWVDRTKFSYWKIGAHSDTVCGCWMDLYTREGIGDIEGRNVREREGCYGARGGASIETDSIIALNHQTIDSVS